MGQFLWSGVSVRPWNVAADRCAREIIRILTVLATRLRRLMREALNVTDTLRPPTPT